MDQTIKNFFEFMKQSTTAVQTTLAVKERLLETGFTPLKLEELWALVPSGKYYVEFHPTMVIAFVLGSSSYLTKGFNMITAHTDNPGFRIKPNPEVSVDGMITLNVEKYGGPIFHTWFDRPLSIAGRISVRSEEVLKPKVLYLDFKRPILTLPSLAIHMNRDVNSGVEIKVQKEMQPLLTQLLDKQVKEGLFLELIATELSIKTSDILDTDLYVYCLEEGTLIGMKEEFISCPRIDDLAMVYAGMEALIDSKPINGINLCAFLDNEEIGSMTRQGADSITLNMVLDRIRSGIGRTPDQFVAQLLDSFIISADGAHALHPNYSEKNDITNKPVMNKGIAIKLSGNRSYASEVESIGALQQLCEKAEIPFQKFVNHSDQPGGKTLGPIVSRNIPVNVVDMGVPMLAMHSTREIMGVKDFLDSIRVFKTFFNLS
jgi:aspartyl aminopeptidase